MRFIPRKQESNIGQTLVETVAAVFILAMGISSALGLAVYANSTSTNITKQIIATGLAREGVEAVKSMRDTNWLKQINIDKNCYSFVNPTAASSTPSCPGGEGNFQSCCYKNWLIEPTCAGSGKTNGYCIDPSGNKAYRIKSSLDSNNKQWTLTEVLGQPLGLYQFKSSDWNDPLAFEGLYVHSPATMSGYAASEYSREVLLLTDNSTNASQDNRLFPYFSQPDIGPQLEVVSRVWWTDKKCPSSPAWPGLGKCSIEIRDFLTNWKNY